MIEGFWSGRRVLVTGHTGFKGGWLCSWLLALGAEVRGIALEPDTDPAFFTQTGLSQRMDSRILDITDRGSVEDVVCAFKPEVVFHLAAQALVRRSYREPVETFNTNVMGTVHVLQAALMAGSVKAVVSVTSDKCYENREWLWGYRENEAMGGHDPYSSSKGCAELVTAAYRLSFAEQAGIAIASARAGNVFGGGDYAEDRLIPDLVSAFSRGDPAVVRNPDAVRPWQFVLEPLHGYLRLAEALLTRPAEVSPAFNFGPDSVAERPVRDIADELSREWGHGACWECQQDPTAVHEAHFLKLDSSRARSELGWKPVLTLNDALKLTSDWYREVEGGADAAGVVARQLQAFSKRLSEAHGSQP